MMKPSGQTINFATKPVCPECGGEIPTNEIAVEKDSAHCPTCAWMLFCIQNEWKLHMVFLFSPGHCSYIVKPTFFKPRAREYSFSRDTTFGLTRGSVIFFSPSRPPEVMTLPFPMTGERMFYLYSRLIDFKYGISAGAFKIGEPNPVQKPPMQSLPWKRMTNISAIASAIQRL